MAILGNKNSFIEDEVDTQEKSIIPATVRNKDEEESLKKSILFSTLLHPTVAGLIWLLILGLTLLGITFPLFSRPKPKMQDIEFVLVDNLPEKQPLNKNTKFRSEKNTRTGGKTDKTRKVSMPSPSPTKKAPAQKSSVSKQKTKTVKKVVKQQPKPKTQSKTTAKPKTTPKPKAASPKPPSARPSIKPPSVPKPSIKRKSSFSVPVPKGGTTSKKYSTGPIGGSSKKATGSSSSGSKSKYSGGSHAPAPSLAPTGGGSSRGSKSSRGASGYGNPGNPGGGGGAPGIDSIREPDFGPYMRDLQRRIKRNWDPPKGNESKRVVLLFKIARDGRLLSATVHTSSGLKSADQAAIHAVQLTAPFRPLPAEFRGKSIDIQFTFDYNVFGASGYR